MGQEHLAKIGNFMSCKSHLDETKKITLADRIYLPSKA
jgi:hypothetical protein